MIEPHVDLVLGEEIKQNFVLMGLPKPPVKSNHPILGIRSSTKGFQKEVWREKNKVILPEVIQKTRTLSFV
jgi:hypothetical protein